MGVSKKYKNILFIFGLFFFTSLLDLSLAGQVKSGNNQQSSSDLKTSVWKFYIQPIAGTTGYADSQAIQWKVLSVEKTMGLVELNLSELKGKNKFTLKLLNKNGEFFKRKVNISKETIKMEKTGTPPLFQLRQKDSKFELINYFKTGVQPKSITFVSNNIISVPLLDDDKSYLIDIWKNKMTPIYPEGKGVRESKGFVETLILPDKSEFWISQLFSHMIQVFDLKTYKFKKTIHLTGRFPKVMTRDNSSGLVYCSNWLTRNISVINPDEYKEVNVINVEGIPRGSVVIPGTHFMYVALFSGPVENDNRGNLIKVDLKSHKIIHRFSQFGAMRHIVLDKIGHLYVSDMLNARIYIYDTKTDKLIKTIPVYYKPNTIALSKDQKYLYVSCRGPNNPNGYELKGFVFGRIYVINTKKMDVTEYWEGGNQPTGLDISPDDKYLVTSDFLDNKIRVYRRLQ